MQTLFFDDKEGLAAESALLSDAAPEDLAEEWRRAKAAQAQSKRAAIFPGALRVVRGICALLAFIVAAGILKSNVSLATAYGNAPYLFWGGGIALAAALLLYLAQLLLTRGNPGRADVQEAAMRVGRAAARIRNELRVPQYALAVDVLSFPSPAAPQLAALKQMELFRRGDSLCLFDGLQVFALPLSGAALRVEQTSLAVERAGWSKSLPPTHKQYRSGGVSAKGKGPLTLRFCCALETQRDGEALRLLFPAYELPLFRQASGLPAPALPEGQ